eukprot:5218110-Lingulodinium_polyedra.AAC.1
MPRRRDTAGPPVFHEGCWQSVAAQARRARPATGLHGSKLHEGAGFSCVAMEAPGGIALGN